VAASSDAKTAADWVLNTRPAPVDTVPAATLASLIGLIAGGTITNSIARQVYEMLVAEPAADPAELVERHGLASIGSSGELEAMVNRGHHPDGRFRELRGAGSCLGHAGRHDRPRPGHAQPALRTLPSSGARHPAPSTHASRGIDHLDSGRA
jgi:hypothetical protein